ncbi:MAG: Asp23/Gls24 family envelope stress response protein [Anaerolineales bacterium]
MSEEKPRPPGATTIAPNVLLTIIRKTTEQTPGVCHLSPAPGGVDRLVHRSQSQGIRLDVQEGRVYVDLYVVLQPDVNLREVSRTIQQRVARAIAEMVGMEVGRVNIHIEDIALDE